MFIPALVVGDRQELDKPT